MARSRLYQRTKNIIHGIQASVVLLAGIITIAIIAQNGGGDSRLTYFLVVCIATFPFLAYQTLVPTIKKTLRFANPYAHAGIDTLSTLLWLVAFLVEIVWVKDGSHAAKDWKKSDKVCNAFAWGSTTRCKLAQVTVGMGVAIDALFAVALAFSIYAISFYRNHGCLPGQDSKASLESLISAADRGENALPTHPAPNDTFDARQEMQETAESQQTPLTADTSSTAIHSPEGRPTLPEHSSSYSPALPQTLPAETRYHQQQSITNANNNNRPQSHPSPNLGFRRHKQDYANLYASQRRANPFSTASSYGPTTSYEPYRHQNTTTISADMQNDEDDEPISPILPHRPPPSYSYSTSPNLTQSQTPGRQLTPQIRVNTAHANRPFHNRDARPVAYQYTQPAQFPAGEYGR